MKKPVYAILFLSSLFIFSCNSSNELADDVKIVSSIDAEKFILSVRPSNINQDVSLRENVGNDLFMNKVDALDLIENSINYIYSIPFSKYDEFQIIRDTIELNLGDCLVSHDRLTSLYSEIWSIVNCNFHCSNLPEEGKNIKIVDIKKLDALDCDDNTIILTSTIGQESAKVDFNIHDWQNENFIDEELYALCNECVETQFEGPPNILNPFEWPDCAAYEISKLASNNFNHIDYYHTFQNVESFQGSELFVLPQNQYFEDFWWRLSCGYGTYNMNDIYTQNCDDFFPGEFHAPFQIYNEFAEEYYCLNTDELNSYLDITEELSHQFADQENKHPIHIFMYPTNYIVKYKTVLANWYGRLEIGTKVYREELPTTPDQECLCM